jgi:hypothetical protein
MAVLNTRDGLQHIDNHGGVLEIPPLPQSTILLVEVGSTAHGTGLPGSEDHDEMGVPIESPEELLGVGERGFLHATQAMRLLGTRGGGHGRRGGGQREKLIAEHGVDTRYAMHSRDSASNGCFAPAPLSRPR